MRPFRVPCVTFALLLMTAALQAQAPRPEPVGLRADAPAYGRHGPYWVGTREFVIKEAAGGRSLPATLWYPALNPKCLKEAITFEYIDNYHPNSGLSGVLKTTLTIEGHALADAAPDPSGGPYPLVTFSHGDENSRLLSVFLQEHLASHGFMVLGVDHPKPDELRPQDVITAIEFAKNLTASAGDFSGLIDVSHVAATGHSHGGRTAMMVAGARYAEKGLTEPRVNAVIAMAMDGEPDLFDFGPATPPTLMLVGSQDRRSKANTQKLYQMLPAAGKTLVVLVGGLHGFPFMDPGIPGVNMGALDTARAHDLVNHFTTIFLLDVLKGDQEAHKALLTESVKFEEIQYTTTWK